MSKKRADLLLVERGLVESRAKAAAAIAAGGVSADGAPVPKASALVDEAAVLTAEPAHPWVGRAGIKLDHALNIWPVPVRGRVVLDVGASTGGFTDVCLARGAARVFAVDVGRDQLHDTLRGAPYVVALEGVDARILDASLIAEPPALIVCDASFIGLAKVLPAALALAAPGAHLVALVKPQCEVGPDKVGKGGLVRDAQDRAEAVASVRAWLEQQGWTVRGEAESPIRGGEGAVEYLLWAFKA